MQGTDAITATSHSDVVIDEDPCSQLMDGEDKMVESPSSTMPAAHISSPHFKSWIYEIDGEAAYNTLDKDDEPLNDPDDDEVNTADTSFTQPHKGQHQLQGVILHCGYKTHGIFCECLATVSKRNITYVVPFGMMKYVEITQQEYDKFNETTANTDSHSISKEKLKQNLLETIDQKRDISDLEYLPTTMPACLPRTVAPPVVDSTTTKPKSRAPNMTPKNTGLVMNCYALRRRMTAARVDKFIRPASAVYMGAVMKYLMAEVLELDKNCAQDMTMMMIETATQRSLHPLNNSTSIPHRIKEKMRQTPEPDAEGMTEEEEEDDPEEEPLRIHITKKEVKKMQLDALSPTFIVSPQHETQKTILSPI